MKVMSMMMMMMMGVLLVASLWPSTVSAAMALNNTCPEPSPPECFCDYLPTVYCRGLSSFPTVLPHETATALVFEDCTMKTVDKNDMAPYAAHLERLTITRSQLERIEPEAFDDMKKLLGLDLSYNELKLDKESFTGPKQLVDLSLKGNNLLVTPNLGDLDDLERLWLSDNENLQFEGSHVMPTRSLREVHLDNCHLRAVPSASFFREVPNIRLLNLDHNVIRELESNAFIYLDELESLSMEHNRLLVVSEHAFESQKKIRYLGLAHNNMTYLDEETFEKFDDELENITLNDNKFKSLGDDLLGSRRALKAVYLANNPWACDCYVQWMRSFEPELVADNDEFVCETPEAFEGWQVLNVTSSMTCDPPHQGLLITISVIIVAVCLLLIMLAVFRICKKRRARAAQNRARDVKYSEVYRDPTERRH